jgi:hypothetical protein
MSDLVGFLRERLNEAEAILRTAKPGPWFADGGHVHTAAHETDEVVDYTASVAHIARWDPARVLAEIEAKRRIIDEHREVRFTEIRLGIRDERVCTTCHGVLDEPADWPGHSDWPFPLIQAWFPCRTLRLLGLPDRDHPDYDPAWTPETP